MREEIGAAWKLIRATQVAVLDIDGVLCVGDRPIAGARAALRELLRIVPQVVFVTNDSRRSTAGQRSRLAHVLPEGMEPTVLTAVDVLIEELVERGHSAVGFWGPAAVAEALSAAGIRVDPDRATALVTAAAPEGWGPEDPPPRGCVELLHRDAEWLASNGDPVVPSPGGAIPDAGAIIARLSKLTGRHPGIVGKPHGPMLRSLRRRVGESSSVLVIGDRLDSDVEFARNGGYAAIHVGDAVSSAGSQPEVRIATLGSLVDR